MWYDPARHGTVEQIGEEMLDLALTRSSAPVTRRRPCSLPTSGFPTVPTGPPRSWPGRAASRRSRRFPFAAEIARRGLAERQIAPEAIDGLCFGTTVPSKHSFYGAPWFAGLAGLGHAERPDDQPGLRHLGALPGPGGPGTGHRWRDGLSGRQRRPDQQRAASVLPESRRPRRHRQRRGLGARQFRPRPVCRRLDAGDGRESGPGGRDQPGGAGGTHPPPVRPVPAGHRRECHLPGSLHAAADRAPRAGRAQGRGDRDGGRGRPRPPPRGWPSSGR